MTAQKPSAVPRTLADDPIIDSEEDHLERAQFARHVVDVLELVRAEKSSTVLALIGPWGSGKSSVLNLVDAELRQPRRDWTVAHFNPWEFSNLQSLAFGFFAELSKAMPEDFQDRTVIETFQTYASRLFSFGGAVTSPLTDLTGINPGKVAETASKLLAPERSVSSLRGRLEAALRERTRATLVVLDDIDRLAPNELLMVFKLVRLLGRLPNICYLLAYDEQTLLSVLQETEVARGNRGRALAYLEKIVQIRLDLPLLHASQLRKMINECLASLKLQRTSNEAEARVRHLFDEELFSKLTEPRSIRRFFAQVRTYLPALSGEVDAADFLALTYLRTYHPAVYRALYSVKRELVFDEKKYQGSGNGAAGFLRNNGICDREEAEQIEGILETLFPRLRSTSFTGDQTELAVNRRAASSECFDRYFYFGVPPGGFSDKRLAAQAAALGTPRHAAAAGELLDQLKTRLDLTASRLMRLVDELPPATCAHLLNLTAQACRESGRKGAFWGGDKVHQLGARLMKRLDRESATSVLRALPPTPTEDLDFLLFSALALRTERISSGRGEGQEAGSLLEEVLLPEVLKKVPERLSPLLQSTLEEVDWCIDLLFCWSILGQREEVQQWMGPHLDSEKSHWTLKHLIGTCISSDYDVSNASSRSHVWGDAFVTALPTFLLPPTLLPKLRELLSSEEGSSQESQGVQVRSEAVKLSEFSNRVRIGAQVLKAHLESNQKPMLAGWL